MKVLTVLTAKAKVVCLDFDQWQATGEIAVVPGINVPLCSTIIEVPSLRSVIGIPDEQQFRIEARRQGYTVLSNTPD